MTARSPWRRALGACAIALSLAAPAHAAINANKSFTPDVVSAGQVSTVTVVFLNANPDAANSLAFTDTLPAGVVVATNPNVTGDCGGSMVANAGDPAVSFSGGSIPAASGVTPGSCQVTFDVTAAVADVYINTIAMGDVTSTEGSNSQQTQATLNVSALAPMSGSKTFAPANIHGNGVPSRVTITLNNPNGVALTNVTFTDALPASLVVATPPLETNSCGGTFAPTGGATSASLAGGTIPAASGTPGSCAVSFLVVTAAPNTPVDANVANTLVAGSITTFEGVTNPLITSNSLRVQTAAQIAKAFAPTTILSGGTSTLTITVRNFNTTDLTPIAFTDAFPVGLSLASPVNAATTCPGLTFSGPPAPGNTSITVAGGTLLGASTPVGVGSGSCTISVDVTATNVGAGPISLVNNVPAGNFGGVNYLVSNNATLTVNSISPLTGTKAFSTPNGPAVQTNWILATVTINNASAFPANNFALDDLLTTMGTGFTFAGAPAPAATSNCGGAFNATGGTLVQFTGGTIPATGSCTLTYPILISATAQTGTRTNTIPPGNVDALINAVATSNTIAITASIPVGVALGVSKAFAPTTVLAGSDSRLTITISHANGVAAFTNLAFTDTLPAGHLVSATPNLVANCGGTVTATSGTNTVSLSGGALGLGATNCSIAVNITTPAGAGAATNTLPIGSVTSTNEGVSNRAAANATLTRVTGTVSLAKSFTPATVALSGTSVMRLRILNNASGAVNLTGVAITDTLPAGMVVHTTPAASFTGTGCTPAGVTAVAGSGVVSISGKTVNANSICTIQVTVRATAAGNLINALPAGALTSAQGISNIDPVAATLASTGVADLSVTKTDGVTQVTAGTSTVYTVTVGNAVGGADVVGALFVDNPPAGMTFTSWTCTPSGTGTCTANGSGAISDTVSIPAGQSLVYSITAAISASATGQITNTVTISPPASVIDTNSTNDTASDTDDIVQTISLAIVKTDNSATYTPGGIGTYVITVTNGGPSDGSNLDFTDNLPAGVTIRAPGVSCAPTGTASCGTAGANTVGTAAVTFTGMQIAAGAGNSVQVSVPVDYAPGMTPSPLVNTASVQRGTEPPVTGQDSSTRAPDIVLDVDKDDGTTTYQPGTTGTYTIVVGNDGVTDANNVALTDTLPAGVTLTANVTCLATAGSSCGTVTGSSGGSSLGTTGANILAGGEITFTVPVAFDITMSAASITNTAIATASDADLPPPGTVTDQDDDTNTLVRPDLTIAKSHTGNFFQGQVGASFSITVTNVGTAPTIGVVSVSDTLPSGLTATAIAGSGWACTQPGGPCSRSDPLAVSASYPVITLTVDVAANAGSPLTNLTTVSGGGETNTANNSATDQVTVDPGPDPTISKSHVGTFYQGQIGATFTITVTNVGGSATVGTVTVSDALPPGLTATAVGGTGWSCTQPAGPCSRSDALAISTSYPSLTLTVDVAGNAGTPLVNQASVSGGGDVNPNNNTASDTVTVDVGPDLTIVKTHTGNFLRGQIGATFAITVSNVGNSPSVGSVSVADTLPPGLAATAIAGAGWTCTQPAGPCTRSDALAASASYPVITLTVDVAANAGSPLVNSTTVSGGGDINPNNNTANDTVLVVSPISTVPRPIPAATPAGLALLVVLLAIAGGVATRRRARLRQRS